MNGRAASPMTVSASPCGQSGAGISSAETNCEETAASTRAAPPRTPPSPISISTGGHPLSRSARTETPSATSASSSGPIGRSRIRWLPSSRKRPRPSVRKPSRKRIAVPAPPASNSPPRAGIAPPRPSTTIRAAASSTASSKPSVPSAAAIRRVSSFRPAPEMVERPFAIAASNSARLVMLLEPGTLRDAPSGCCGGTISISSTSMLRSRA
jgi:hypothetical protein